MVNLITLAYGIAVYTPFLMAMNGMIPKKMDDKGKSKIAKLMELLKNGDLTLGEYDKKMRKMKCIEEE